MTAPRERPEDPGAEVSQLVACPGAQSEALRTQVPHSRSSFQCGQPLAREQTAKGTCLRGDGQAKWRRRLCREKEAFEKIDVLSAIKEGSTSRKSGDWTENKKQLLEINKPQ